jgi:hypothetical protein
MSWYKVVLIEQQQPEQQQQQQPEQLPNHVQQHESITYEVARCLALGIVALLESPGDVGAKAFGASLHRAMQLAYQSNNQWLLASVAQAFLPEAERSIEQWQRFGGDSSECNSGALLAYCWLGRLWAIEKTGMATKRAPPQW